MRLRPLSVTAAAVLMVLLSLTNLPLPWVLIFPDAPEPPAFILYLGIVLAIVGLVAAAGLWVLKRWSVWTTVVVCVLNFALAVLGMEEVPSSELRAAIVATAIVAVLIIVLVMLPASRRAFSR